VFGPLASREWDSAGIALCASLPFVRTPRMACVDGSCIASPFFGLICAFVRSSHVSGLFARFRPLALMGSANQVPYSLAGYEARAIRRGVLVLAADLCTIISQVLLTRCSFRLRLWNGGCRVHRGSGQPKRSWRSCLPWRLSRHGRVCVRATTSAICWPALDAIVFV